jgi:NAD(P)-dependent dehydrogenase (short-subunit alcohol dehydrogenase family)
MTELGRTALVTGATSGIGRAIALQLAAAARGSRPRRSSERGSEVVREIESGGGKARFVSADLSSSDDVRRLAGESGPTDVLVNNAGIYRFAPTTGTDDASFDQHVNINLRAPFILVQELVPGMVARGFGVVANVSTVAAAVPARDAGIYGATKAGIEILTKTWADEFGNAGVRVNVVRAGPTETPGTAVTPGLTDGLATTTALGRVAAADEIANVVTFVCSPGASYINGAVLDVTGGQRAIAP